MSGDSIANVEEVEVDVISLLAKEGEEAENEVVDEVDESMPETVEELQALLAKKNEIIGKRNKSLKKSKQAQHRTQEEKDAFLSRLEAIEQRGNQQPSAEAESLAKEEQDWRDRVEDDHSQALDYADWKNSQTIDKVAAYIDKMNTSFESKLSALQSATDPERAKYATQIESLRTKDGFADLDEDTLLKVAKGLSGVKAPRGTVGGGRGGAEVKSEQTPEQKKAMLREMGFDA